MKLHADTHLFIWLTDFCKNLHISTVCVQYIQILWPYTEITQDWWSSLNMWCGIHTRRLDQTNSFRALHKVVTKICQIPTKYLFPSRERNFLENVLLSTLRPSEVLIFTRQERMTNILTAMWAEYLYTYMCMCIYKAL